MLQLLNRINFSFEINCLSFNLVLDKKKTRNIHATLKCILYIFRGNIAFCVDIIPDRKNLCFLLA